jgi:hypothetical protein
MSSAPKDLESELAVMMVTAFLYQEIKIDSNTQIIKQANG